MTVLSAPRLVTVSLLTAVADACTSMLFAPGATTDGYPITSHAADCNSCDNRMAYIPAKQDLQGLRPVYDVINNYYPRFIQHNRSEIYEPTAEYPDIFAPKGYVHQPGYRFALWESTYPLINEHGLAIGESTTSAKPELANRGGGADDPTVKEGSAHPPIALFTISQLMAVAMEQCRDALCAIDTMGRYAQEYGFAGEEYGASEAVTVIDPTQAWVFEIHGDAANGAIWVAQRVPHGHVVVISNSCVIQDVLTDQPDNFKYSSNLHSVAQEHGLWSPANNRPLNWQRDIGKPLALPRYASLRTWRVMDRVAPSLRLPMAEDPFDLPFSVPADKPVSLNDVFELFGDHFEGTEFDMTQGALAGPFGNPNHELTGQDMKAVEGGGQIPRAISLHRTSYTMVAHAKPASSAVWYAVDAPATSVFVPFYADALRGGGAYSPRYGTSDAPRLQNFDRESAFWAFDFVANWMGLNYRNMSTEMVYPKKRQLQRWVLDRAAEAEEAQAQAEQGTSRNGLSSAQALADAQTRIQDYVASEWWRFADELVVRYNDGYFNFHESKNKFQGKALSLPYPSEWLKMIGFSQDFFQPTKHWVQPADRDLRKRT